MWRQPGAAPAAALLPDAPVHLPVETEPAFPEKFQAGAHHVRVVKDARVLRDSARALLTPYAGR